MTQPPRLPHKDRRPDRRRVRAGWLARTDLTSGILAIRQALRLGHRGPRGPGDRQEPRGAAGRRRAGPRLRTRVTAAVRATAPPDASPPPPLCTITCRDIAAEAVEVLAAKGFDWRGVI